MNFTGAFVNPYKDKINQLELSYEPKTVYGAMTFLNGKEKGRSFGPKDSESFEMIDC
jgi:hypothetical protein